MVISVNAPVPIFSCHLYTKPPPVTVAVKTEFVPTIVTVDAWGWAVITPAALAVITKEFVAWGLPTFVGIPVAPTAPSSASARLLLDVKFADVNEPAASIASKHPSPSASTSKWFGMPSKSISYASGMPSLLVSV